MHTTALPLSFSLVCGFLVVGVFFVVSFCFFSCLFVLNGRDLAGRGVLGHKKVFTERPVSPAQTENYIFTH